MKRQVRLFYDFGDKKAKEEKERKKKTTLLDISVLVDFAFRFSSAWSIKKNIFRPVLDSFFQEVKIKVDEINFSFSVSFSCRKCHWREAMLYGIIVVAREKQI